MNAEQRALARLKEAMKARRVSQRELANEMRCSQARIAKILRGRAHLRVRDLERLSDILGVALVETIRDRGREFYAELTPSELKALTLLRESPQLQRSVYALLEAATISGALSEKRRLRLKSPSGKTPSLHRGFPDGVDQPVPATDIDQLRALASTLSAQLALFASGGREPVKIQKVD